MSECENTTPRLKSGLRALDDSDAGGRCRTGNITVKGESVKRFAKVSGDRQAFDSEEGCTLEPGSPSRVSQDPFVLYLTPGRGNSSLVRPGAAASRELYISYQK